MRSIADDLPSPSELSRLFDFDFLCDLVFFCDGGQIGIYEKCSDRVVGLFLFPARPFWGGSDCKAVCPLPGFKIGERTARRQLPVLFLTSPTQDSMRKMAGLQGGRSGGCQAAPSGSERNYGPDC